MNATSASLVPSPGRDTRFLDGLRGLAALEVLVGHARWLLHEGYHSYLGHPSTYSAWQKTLLYFLTTFRFGQEAVIFFFVLSGFVIHLRYAKRIVKDPQGARFDYLPFVGRRARRLYPVLLVTILLGFALDSWGIAHGYPIYFGHTAYASINNNGAFVDVQSHLTFTTLLGNLAFVMATYVPCWGTNGPLWSLKCEWWFYMLYPAFWFVFRRWIVAAACLIAGLFVLSFYPQVWPLKLLRDVFSGMILWWMGVLLADVYAGRIRVPFKALAPLVLLLPLAAVFHLNDVCWGVGFSGLIAAAFAWQQSGRSLWPLAAVKPLGDMSYSLYVCHFPMIALLSGWLLSRSPTRELPSGFLYVWLGIAGTLVVAYFVHLVAERPFQGRRDGKPNTSSGAAPPTVIARG